MNTQTYAEYEWKMHLLFASLYFVLALAQEIPENDDLPTKFDDYEENYARPVPFGHIFLDGFEDPSLGLKQPIDLLEYSMRRINNLDEARRLLNSTMRDKVHIIWPPRLTPRDEHIMFNISEVSKKDESKNSVPMWYKFAAIQTRNVQQSPSAKRQYRPSNIKVYDDPPPSFLPNNKFDSKDPYILNEKLDIPVKLKKKVNWTTCEEFGNGTFLYPRDVVDVDWVPFYIWMENEYKISYATVHRFSYPTLKLVKQYHDECVGRLNRTVDWQQPKLLMNDMLLIAMDKRGQFHGISKPNVPPSMKNKTGIIVPSLIVRLKMIDSYLMMVFCGANYATVMAVSGEEPKTYKEKIATASATGFKGVGKPVWRDLRGERMRMIAERREKQMDIENRFLKTNEQIPITRE